MLCPYGIVFEGRANLSKSALQPAGTPDVWPLINRLGHLKRDWPGETALRRLDSRTIEALLQFILAQDKARLTAYWPIILLMLFGVLILAMVLHVFTLGILIPILLCSLLLHHEPSRLQRIATYALTQNNDVRVLPALIKATRQEWGRHPEVFRALERLLKLVREEHFGLIDAARQNQLWFLAVAPLEYSQHYNEPLALDALRALARIGNAGILIKMQRLAEQTARREPHRRVIKAARELAPLMETRLERQKVPQTLLRAADMPTSQPETLLRPACAADAEPAEQLLRASHATGQE